MSQFLARDFWNGINAICQIVIALGAIIAIGITFRQISSKSKVKLNMSLGFRLNNTKIGEKMEMTVEICLNIANMGIAPVYITSCGINLFDGKVNKSEVIVDNEIFVLECGQCISKSSPYFSFWFPEIKENAALHDRIRIFAICGTGKAYYKEYDYQEFLFEYQNIADRIDEIKK